MQQSGDLRLIDFERHRDFGLGKPTPFHDPIDGGCKTGFGVEFCGIRQPHVGKDIAAAGYHSFRGCFSHISPRSPVAPALDVGAPVQHRIAWSRSRAATSSDLTLPLLGITRSVAALAISLLVVPLRQL